VLGQPGDAGGEHGPVGPVQPWSWVGAAQDGDLVAQHEELDARLLAPHTVRTLRLVADHILKGPALC
jgi:hypothetical protein